MGQIHLAEAELTTRGRRDPTENSDVPIVLNVLTPQQLATKYRQSWNGATEAQRKSLCRRFDLRYTQKEDDELLIVVAKRQEEEYTRVFNRLDSVMTKASWADTFGKAMAMKKSPRDAEQEANERFPNAWNK